MLTLAKDLWGSVRRAPSELIYDGLFVFTLAVAFLIRFPYLFVERMGSDEALYSWYAKRIASDFSLLFTKEIVEFHPPLFPLLLNLGRIFASPDLAYRLVVLTFSLSGIVLIYILGVQLKSRFVGLFCAVNLAFNFLYLYNGALIKTDVPLTVFYLLLLLVLVKTEMSGYRHQDVIVGILSSMVILLKWTGIVVVPTMILFYLFLPQEKVFLKRIKRLALPLSIVCGTIVLLCLNNALQMGTVLPDMSAFNPRGLGQGVKHYLFNLFNILMLPYLLPLFVYGAYSVLKNKGRFGCFFLLLFLVNFLTVSFTAAKDLRFSLLILPIMLMITGIGLECFLDKAAKREKKQMAIKVFALFVLGVVLGGHYPYSARLMKYNFTRVTGYQEAGEWIKRNMPEGAAVISQNPRILRYYSDINFKEFGGQIIECPRYKKDFEAVISNIKGPIILEVNPWSESKKGDFYPFANEEKDEEYLKLRGFRPAQRVLKKVYSLKTDKMVTRCVVKSFERPGL